MFLPLGIEDAKVHRLPVISIGIAAACVALYLFMPALDGGEAALTPALAEWQSHPYLEEPPALHGLVQPGAEGLLNRLALDVGRPPADALALEQRKLDDDAEAARIRFDATPLRRYGLVGARGLHQVGWLFHMFLHMGFLHLLGNLFFLYLVGPLLEDAWGRPLYAGFYLVGGLVAALAQVLPQIDSQAAMVGASGAVAACMGAFAVRFARRRVRVGYFFWLFRMLYGTFLVPAWLWLGFWFVEEVASAILTPHAGIAFMAHVGGFGFGALFAAGMFAGGVEKKLAPAVERTHTWSASPALDEARERVARGDGVGALLVLEKALAGRLDDPDLLLALARLELEAGRLEAAATCEKLVAHHLRRGDEEALKQVALDLGEPLAAVLRPTSAFRAGMAVGEGPLALALLTRATQAGGPIGERAAARVAEIHAATVKPPQPDRFAPIELGHKPPQVLHCRLVSVEPDRVCLRATDGRDMAVPFVRLQRLGAAVVAEMPARDGLRRDVLVVELVIDGGDGERPPRCLRIPGSYLGEDRDGALRALVRGAEAASVPVVPRNPPGRFADLVAFEDAIYG